MNLGNAGLLIAVALFVLIAVLYNRTSCFGGFLSCMFGSGTSTGSATSGPLQPVQTLSGMPTPAVAQPSVTSQLYTGMA